MLNLVVVFETHISKGMTPLWAAKFEKQLLRKAQGNNRSHTDSMLPFLAAEVAMHE